MRRIIGIQGAKYGLILTSSLAIALVMGIIPLSAQQDDNTQENAFAEKFWNYLQEVDYREKWSRWPGIEQEFKQGASPHGEFLKVYVNDEVKGNLEDPPIKSIIIKENYDKDKNLVAITPMYRVGKDYDPEHNDWYWAKHKPDGALFEMNGVKLSGKLKGCIECHSSAKGDDYIFTNDEK